MMNIVITMGGLGSRFKKAGFTQPKYMIEVKGKSLFSWSMDSLEDFKNEFFIFLVRKEDSATEYIQYECKKNRIHNYQIVELEKLTRGQAETAYLASTCWDKANPLLIYNIDTFVEIGQLRKKKLKGDGFIPCFYGAGDHWSFVSVNEENKAIEIREKKRISSNCTIGAYYFKSASMYEAIYNDLYVKKHYLEQGEQYVAPMYNYMVQNGYDVFIDIIPESKVHVLGTPEEIKIFSHTK